jgi:hypothetical protein
MHANPQPHTRQLKPLVQPIILGVGVTVIPLLTPLLPGIAVEVTKVFHIIEGVAVALPPPPGAERQIPRDFKKLLTAGTQAAHEQICTKQGVESISVSCKYLHYLLKKNLGLRIHTPCSPFSKHLDSAAESLACRADAIQEIVPVRPMQAFKLHVGGRNPRANLRANLFCSSTGYA